MDMDRYLWDGTKSQNFSHKTADELKGRPNQLAELCAHLSYAVRECALNGVFWLHRRHGRNALERTGGGLPDLSQLPGMSELLKLAELNGWLSQGSQDYQICQSYKRERKLPD